MRSRFYLLPILFLLPLFAAGQMINTEFGKNRIQYHKDFEDWSEYESTNFTTYWYGEARNVGQAAVMIAEQEFESIQTILEYRMNRKIEIIVYVDITDLKQSNIGSEETFINSTGQTKIVGNKMFVHFNGDHNDLRRQIREGIASVFINAMLFGSSLQEIVQNAVMMNLPEWFKQGLIGYCGEPWTIEADNELRDIFMSDDYEGFDKLARKNPRLAGHSMWYYISKSYGKSTVSNLVYLTRINRSVESGILYVLGSTYDGINIAWDDFYKQRYQLESNNFDSIALRQIPIKNKRKLPLSQLVISPDGKQVAYVTNQVGKTKVYVQDVETGDRKMIFKNGYKNAIQATDYNYPILAWHPNNYQLAIIYEKRDVIQLRLFDTGTGESTTEPLDPQYQRINSADFLDGNTLVFSATVWGFSDLFYYFINTRQSVRITNDYWDDLDARVVNLRNKRGLLFSSNRPNVEKANLRMDTILPLGDFDIFYYDLDAKPNEFVPVTDTDISNEYSPMAIDTTWFGYRSDHTGIFNLSSGYLEDYIAWHERVVKLKDGEELIFHKDSSFAKVDSAAIDSIFVRPVIKTRGVSHFQTNIDRNIFTLSSAPKVGKYVKAIVKDEKTQVFIGDLNPEEEVIPKPTKFAGSKFARQRILNRIEKAIEEKLEEEVTPPPPAKEEKQPDLPKGEEEKIDIDNYKFQTEFDDYQPEQKAKIVIENKVKETTISSDKKRIVAVKPSEVHRFRPARIIPYRLKFRTDFFTTNLDNNLLFGGLNSFAGTPEDFRTPVAGILMKANFKDLLEDYQIEGGVRVPTTFDGAEYFLFLDDKKHRIDKRYAYYRRNQKTVLDRASIFPRRFESTTNLALTQWRYPFNVYKSLRATGTIRTDRLTPLSTDQNSLVSAITREQRAGVKLEYVFDNSLDYALNIKHGTRYKFYAEAVKRFEFNLSDDVSFKFNSGWMGVAGFDARHYVPFLKHSVLALRAAGSTSFGSEKILYYLGGVENWVFQQFDQTIPVPQGDFAYQTIAANLRGFKMNIRNGNSFALVNTEVRMPLLKYLWPRTRSAFVRNFQAVGFFDAGTAWQGLTPFSKENPINTVYLYENNQNPDRSNVVMKVNYFRDPLVGGYGFGARMMLFGYFFRVDYAYGIETREVQKPRLYIALGMDF